jgi:hypothetical protein
MIDGNPLTYDDIKDLAKQLRRPASTLYVLSSNNDPFYIGPGRRVLAQWFKDSVWPLVESVDRVHLRRVHYVIVSLKRPLQKPDGTPYQNTETSRSTLGVASVAARELGLLDAGRFIDRRAGEPVVIHERTLVDAITKAIFETSMVTDANVMALRTGETASALMTCLACVLAMSPAAARSPTALRRTVDELGKRLRRRVAYAEADEDLRDFLRRVFNGTDIEGSA